MAVFVLGVRHHGPGSARSVAAALRALGPDAVLIEGPPEAEAVVALAAEAEMEPPVALLGYVPDEPRRAAFYPLAAFSPEWQAIQHALARDVPLRFIDLPLAHVLAEDEDAADEAPFDQDPLGALARAAGHDDPERWWEDVVEHRRTDASGGPGDGGAGDEDAGGPGDAEADGAGETRGADGITHAALAPFAVVAEAMAALREDAGEPGPREARREAAMRRAIRAAVKEGFERIAVVCGAWHVPALDPASFPSAAADGALLRGLPKAKVATTWVPWTAGRLAYASGYGAGVTSPGWYAHLFTAPDHVVTRWFQRAAVLLREEGIDASSASLIEAVRLADALAGLRGRPLAGLPEVDDAALAVLGGGDATTLALIDRKLTVGDALGRVPDATPMVPLARDLARRQKTLRLKPQAGVTAKELDLRKDTDLERSHLLHRLALLGVDWGQPARSEVRGTGTFREAWRLEWRPELALALIDAGRHGTTIEAAATARTVADAEAAETLAGLTALVEAALLAALPAAVASVMRTLEARAAHDGDVGRLMDAVVPLARARRYGSVRRADADALTGVVGGLVARVCVGLGPACASLDDAAAAAMVARVDAMHGAVGTLEDAELAAQWRGALAGLGERAGVHGRLTGRATRLLLDAGALEVEEAGRRLSRALSAGTPPAAAASWLEGFLAGSGLVLLHDPALLALIDGWLARVPLQTFDDVLPLLRRTFTGFAIGERRQLGAAVRGLHGDGASAAAGRAAEDDLDPDRVALVLPRLAELLGVTLP